MTGYGSCEIVNFLLSQLCSGDDARAAAALCNSSGFETLEDFRGAVISDIKGVSELSVTARAALQQLLTRAEAISRKRLKAGQVPGVAGSLESAAPVACVGASASSTADL